MKIRKVVITLIIINLIIILTIGIAGFNYLIGQGEAQVVSVNINTKKEIPAVSQEDFVDVRMYIPDIEIELRYATSNNITHSVLYKNSNVYLRKGTADKLKKANYEFKKLGYRIKIWDAYRPTDVQKVLWSKVSDSRYIANPNGGSNHSRGSAVDITLVNKNGREITMPTDFDGFSKKADRDYSDVDKISAENAKFLESIMVKCGFESIYTEWWHFDDSDSKKYGIVDEVSAEDVVEVYNGKEIEDPNISGEALVSSNPDFIEKIRTGFNNIDIGKLKIMFKNQVMKIKNIINAYKTN